jgi:hypothetical protein
MHCRSCTTTHGAVAAPSSGINVNLVSRMTVPYSTRKRVR